MNRRFSSPTNLKNREKSPTHFLLKSFQNETRSAVTEGFFTHLTIIFFNKFVSSGVASSIDPNKVKEITIRQKKEGKRFKVAFSQFSCININGA